MPYSKNDPEKYTIEEMLDRLKSRDDAEEEDDGELVTRKDGTKALKFRKRNRRTDQTRSKFKAQNQRVQMFQIAGFIIFMVLLLVVGGVLILYLNSSTFHDNLITKIENASGSEAKIQQFRINPATASAARLEMNWPEAHALKRLETNSLRAKISPISFVGKVFQGEEIVAAKGNLFLTAPHSQVRSSSKSTKDGDSMIKFSRYSVTSLNVFFSEKMSSDLMIENVEASYLPIKTNKGGEIRLIQGLLKMKGWPSLALDRSYIQVTGRELDVKSLRFQIPVTPNQKIQESGSIDLSGTISPLDEDVTHKLSVDLDSFQISHLLGSSLGQFFRGKAITKTDEASNSFQFTPGSEQDALLKLNMSNALDSRIALSQFKFLGQLAIALDDRWYELPFFDDEVKLLMKRSSVMIDLEEIYLKQRSRMVVQGSISVKDVNGNISGMINVGIPEIIIAASKNRRLDVLFSPVRDGYRWINLKLGGNSDSPVDNFKEQYQAVSLTNIQELKTDSKTDVIDTFDRLIEVK
jgi:hypothetical protein